MISVISPAKKLNFNADSPIKAFSQCDFLDESKKLVDEAKDYSFDEKAIYSCVVVDRGQPNDDYWKE